MESEETIKLDALRRSHQAILDYEENCKARGRHRSRLEMGNMLPVWNQHLEQWNLAAANAGVTEPCLLLTGLQDICVVLGRPLPAAATAPVEKAAPPKKRRGRKKKAEKPAPSKSAGKDTETGRDPGADSEATSTDPADKLLPKGSWLASHAKIVKREVPKVKAAAADPEKYTAAKDAFLMRNLPKLEAYAAKPAKGKSPLFTFCILYLFDTGRLDEALALAERAIELRQESTVKRNFHEIMFDLRMEHLEAQAQAVTALGKIGPEFDAVKALRDQLMNDPFRGNHAKAKVCKSFALAALALGQFEAARTNLLEIKFLDPDMGIITLLAKAEAGLNGEPTKDE